MVAEGRKLQLFLMLGDLAVIGAVTMAGFATHGELQGAGLRLLTTFLSLALSWWAASWFGNLYDVAGALRANQLWRPFWGAVLAGPMAVLIRSLFLELRPMMPVFALVLTGVSACAILAWRLAFYLVFRGKGAQ
jgi:hypothetical protein